MEKVKKFFNIKGKYTFDYNDIRCAITLVNVVLIMIFGLSVAYIGLIIAIIGTVRDLTIEERRINSTVMHATNILLNCYFVSLLIKQFNKAGNGFIFSCSSLNFSQSRPGEIVNFLTIIRGALNQQLGMAN